MFFALWLRSVTKWVQADSILSVFYCTRQLLRISVGIHSDSKCMERLCYVYVYSDNKHLNFVLMLKLLIYGSYWTVSQISKVTQVCIGLIFTSYCTVINWISWFSLLLYFRFLSYMIDLVCSLCRCRLNTVLDLYFRQTTCLLQIL